MARITTLPAAVKARIEEIQGLEKSVVIYKAATIESEFKARTEKVRGRCVVIRVTGGKNEGKAKSSAYASTITVSIFVVPTLKPSKDAETLMTEIEAKLHGWWPDSVAHNTAVYLKAESFSFPEHPKYDIAVLTMKTPPTPLI